ncbi:YtxH domain-containing protein [Flavobacterium sp. 14A]|uniref:YtxH domain-containing protein n=1 Tax=Flavobacterium sp. 14A TaxID=2735896 RepID=UPI00156DE396|nr:YtxH domain-containing protein [Flavobacterium sp. 14A]NRT13109.1 gas vesicle protein [Flavobacterium sp. 14A]
MSDKSGLTLIAVLTGVAIGAGVGILFAPEKGSKTRVKIKDGYKGAKKDLKNKYDDLSVEMKEKLAVAKTDLEDTYGELVSNMSNKTEDVITFLESKLADLKEQNAKLQKK